MSPLFEHLEEIDHLIDDQRARRSREGKRPTPSADVFQDCDERLRRLGLEREAAAAAVRHASERAAQATVERQRAEEMLGALFHQVRLLRSARQALNGNLLHTRRRLAEVQHDLALLTRREAAECAELEDVEAQLVTIAGSVEEA